jgi:hypothetical protein
MGIGSRMADDGAIVLGHDVAPLAFQLRDLGAVGIQGDFAGPTDQQARHPRGFGFPPCDRFGVGDAGRTDLHAAILFPWRAYCPCTIAV